MEHALANQNVYPYSFVGYDSPEGEKKKRVKLNIYILINILFLPLYKFACMWEHIKIHATHKI